MKKNHIKKSAYSALLCIAVLLTSCFLAGCSSGGEPETTSAADSGSSSEEVLSEYEQLKADIVGMWMDEGGPVMGPSPVFGDNYQFYEFTSDNKIVYHHLFKDANGVIGEGASEAGTYRIDKEDDRNLLVYETQNAGAYISIDGNTLIMVNDNGETRYTKLSMEQASAYLLYYTDEELSAEQEQYLSELYAAEDAEKAAAEENEDDADSEETDADASADTAAETDENVSDETEASVSE